MSEAEAGEGRRGKGGARGVRDWRQRLGIAGSTTGNTPPRPNTSEGDYEGEGARRMLIEFLPHLGRRQASRRAKSGSSSSSAYCAATQKSSGLETRPSARACFESTDCSA